MFQFYLHVRTANESDKDASVKGFNDYAEAQKEKAWFEKLGYVCTIKYR